MLRDVPGEPGGVLQSRTCLLPMITPDSNQQLRLYGHYKHRVLPFGGGLLEQPNFYIEAMEILAGREAGILTELAEKQRREAERHGLPPARGWPNSRGPDTR